MSELPPDEETPPPLSNIDDDWIYNNVIGSVTDAINATPPPSSSRIPKVPGTLRDKHDYNKYFAPKVVSIGPYHFMTAETQRFQKRKGVIAMNLLDNNRVTLGRLFKKLGDPKMVEDLRSYYELQDHLQQQQQLGGREDLRSRYEEKVGMTIEDIEFTKMMLLDSCFILYFTRFVFSRRVDEYSSELTSNEISLVYRDLFLLENQIPFKVLKEAIESINEEWLIYVGAIIHCACFNGIHEIDFESGHLFVTSLDLQTVVRRYMDNVQHLLGAVHRELCSTMDSTTAGTIKTFRQVNFGVVNFRKVSELVDVGIHFKPIKGTWPSFTHIEFVKDWWRFSATVKLPPIFVNDTTKHRLLNLIAYEMCNCSNTDLWVTSYVCLLDSLIDDAEDVKILRKAWVLEHLLSSDKEVADLFNEIAKGLTPMEFAYIEAKEKMQTHYRSTRNTLFSQLKNEYFKSPWAIFAVIGALILLILTIVQTYYTVWSPKSTCDDLCMFLKINHHL